MVRMAGDWTREAACLGADTDVWFPQRGENAKTLTAKRTCHGCGSRAECLWAALMKPENYGIWGGCGEPGRRYLRRLNRDCPHPGEGVQEGCRCDFCLTWAGHWERLEVLAETGRGPSPAWNVNGPRARHGTRSCGKRGCRRPECRAAMRADYDESAA